MFCCGCFSIYCSVVTLEILLFSFKKKKLHDESNIPLPEKDGSMVGLVVEENIKNSLCIYRLKGVDPFAFARCVAF